MSADGRTEPKLQGMTPPKTDDRAEDAVRDVVIRTLTVEELASRRAEFVEILVACVDGGASVSFLSPLPREKAEAFWREAAEEIATGDRVLLIAEEAGTGALLGTVQLVLAKQDNGPFRAEVAKMLVSPRARRRGVGAALMRAVEVEALARGRTLLVLDTVPGQEGERLYARLGWTRVGEIPGYAYGPDGTPCATAVFYKTLGTPGTLSSER